MCNCKKSVQKTSGVKAVSKPAAAPASSSIQTAKRAVSAKRPSSVKRVVVRRPL